MAAAAARPVPLASAESRAKAERRSLPISKAILSNGSSRGSGSTDIHPEHPSNNSNGSQSQASPRLSGSSQLKAPFDGGRRSSTRAEQPLKRGASVSSCDQQDFAVRPRGLGIFQILVQASRPYCRTLVKNKAYQVLMLIALMVALFLPDVWVIMDRPTMLTLDMILTFVMVSFLLELAVQSVALTRTYLWSFFFWMDLLGTASVLLDVSYISAAGSASESQTGSSVVILRVARIAKLAARAGRFSKIIKLLRFLPGMRNQATDQGTAKNMSARLITALSMRISLLIIVMVIVLPSFNFIRYPEQDWSMQSWLEILEMELQKNSESFRAQLEFFYTAYEGKDYYPYRLSLKPGASLPSGLALGGFNRLGPASPRNVLRLEGALLVCELNFTRPHQMDAWLNVGMQLFVMVLIVINALMLNTYVRGFVLRPIEDIMLKVQTMTSTIRKSVNDMTSKVDSLANHQTVADDDAEEPDQVQSETQMLEAVLQKIAVLSDIAMAKSLVDAEVLEALSDREKAVIQGYTNVPARRGSSKGSTTSSQKRDSDTGDHVEDWLAQKAIVENAGLSLEIINSFKLNPLELDRARNHAACMFFLGGLNHGVAVESVTMGHFLEEVENGYRREVPYHNWYHAVDVAHCVYRLLNICNAESFFNSCERYALLVSAIAHDLGHTGFNNIFLSETSHELALRYNDKSPLENMHCAKLFEIVSIPKCDVFESLANQQYKDVRKVCIEAILHTDNTHHTKMIKEVQMLCELNSEVLSGLRADCDAGKPFKPSRAAIDIFRQPDSLKLMLSLFLHFSDISNPMKPFRICRIWSSKVIEEFFVQGDEEKRLGIPVQVLNDREKVNWSFSQVGFIEFLVSPLALVVLKLLPPVEPFCNELAVNVGFWQQYWLSETQPTPSEAEKKSLADRITNLQRKYRVTP